MRDTRGRQRFHGAFTGGFSAGFFNTVGSRDGFQPASFVSSRSTRAERRPARPDDFMDDEVHSSHRPHRRLIEAWCDWGCFGMTSSRGLLDLDITLDLALHIIGVNRHIMTFKMTFTIMCILSRYLLSPMQVN